MMPYHPESTHFMRTVRDAYRSAVEKGAPRGEVLSALMVQVCAHVSAEKSPGAQCGLYLTIVRTLSRTIRWSRIVANDK